MQFKLQKSFAGAVLLALTSSIYSAAHAEIDFNTLAMPNESAAASSGDGALSTRHVTSGVESGTDRAPGGAIFNPFSPPAERPSPAPAAIAHPPKAPEPDAAVSFTLIMTAAGAALAGWLLHRRRHAESSLSMPGVNRAGKACCTRRGERPWP